jgi:hypothetical protein
MRKVRIPGYALQLNIDLATAHTDVEVCCSGEGLIVDRLDGYLSVKVNVPNGDAIPLRSCPNLRASFLRLYFSNIGQAGKTARLFILSGQLGGHSITTPAVQGSYLAPSVLGVGGSSTVWTPAAGKAIRLKRLSVSVDAATRIDLLWNTTAWESYYLAANGTVVINLVNCEEVGPKDGLLAVKSSAAATVSARMTGEEI